MTPSESSSSAKDTIVRQRELIEGLIRAWPGGKDSVSFAGVARQVYDVIGEHSYLWEGLGGPPPKGRCGYEQFEPDNGDEPIGRETALEGINAIRNSIVGAQAFNWSEHMYPLVSLLNRAGYRGLPYPEAKLNIGRLIDFREEALVLLRAARGEALTRELHDRIAEFLERVDV